MAPAWKAGGLIAHEGSNPSPSASAIFDSNLLLLKIDEFR